MKSLARFGFSGEYYLAKAKDVAHRCARVVHDLRSASLEPEGKARGRLLLSYQLEPFVTNPAKAGPMHPVNWHSNNWETREMAKAFLEMGYGVDAITWLNRAHVPRRPYDVVIDIRYNLQRWAPVLGPQCLKLFHIDSSHALFRNAAEARRLWELQQRRSVSLQVRLFEYPNFGIEHCDCATVLGNSFTQSTYSYARKPMFSLPVSSTVSMPWPEDKNFDACRRSFIWLGSRGLVSKGLDLVLEAFAGLPDYNLTVCGPVDQECDFQRAYHRELYETPNITTLGWTDVRSEKFAELVRQSVGMVYASCSEGQAGAVVNCMSAGLIPIVSRESGIDVDSFGCLLRDCSVDEIRASVVRLSLLPAESLRARSYATWADAVQNHSREAWSMAYRRVIKEILRLHNLGELRRSTDLADSVSDQFENQLWKG